MKKISILLLSVIAIGVVVSIKNHPVLTKNITNIESILSEKKSAKKVLILPLNGGANEQYIDSAVSYLKSYFPESEIIKGTNINLPKYCFNGNRYRSDSILKFLDEIKPDSIFRIIAITSDDISCTRTLIRNDKPITYPDYGIIGMGSLTKGVCVVSSYRVSKNIYSFAKVVTHEFMHTLGVRHCNHKCCIMQDGKGSGKSLRNANHIHETCLKKAQLGFEGNQKKLMVLNMKLKNN